MRRVGLGLVALVLLLAGLACGRGRAPKVLVLGFDGMDPVLLRQFMAQGKLPNFSRLAQEGCFLPLGTTNPPQSPVAWSTFITGLDPQGHGVFDFVHRDPTALTPIPSLNGVEDGHFQLLREGTPFWRYLEKAGIPARLVKLPAIFPTDEHSGTYLTDMGTPDLEGTYGTYSFYSDAPPPASTHPQAGGRRIQIEVRDGVVKGSLVGPPKADKEGENETLPFQVQVDTKTGAALFEVQDQKALLKPGEWSAWLPVTFPSANGMVMVYLQSLQPHFSLYTSPINIDPANAVIPVSYPPRYAHALYEECGRFYTQGMPEETAALLDGLFTDEDYLKQNSIVVEERRRLFQAELAKFQEGLFFFYVSSSDILAHLYWNTIDPQHPGYKKERAEKYEHVILSAYTLADEFVGQAMQAAGGDTTLLVISDHGFAPFRRAVNLNLWLREHGYQRNPGKTMSQMDWAATRVYAVGFNSLYLNLEGREAKGIVPPAERNRVLGELSHKLLALKDPKTGQKVISKVEILPPGSGPLKDVTPDLLVGYARGYRASWETALGEAGESLLEDNTGAWSGDHLINPDLVPGVLLANRPAPALEPRLRDLAPTLLKLYGVTLPDGLSGQPLW